MRGLFGKKDTKEILILNGLIKKGDTMQNYHRHTSYSNIMTPDSAVSNEDYAKRAVELGQKVLSSVEHGWQGYYHEVFELAQKYGLKFIFGAEAYWVNDNLEKDRTNNHIILLAKNEQGRREINRILSDANIDGYYFKPRVDKKSILSLTPENVFVTTACVGFWGYGLNETTDFVKTLHNHFGDNFRLEVQYHWTDKQKTLNQFLQKLSRELGIGMIVGLDSHYIYPEQNQDREYRLEASHIKYEDEEGWFMDYPDENEVYNRFKTQGILTDEEIRAAIDATDELLDFEDIYFDKEVKLPVPPMYADKTKEERAKIYSQLITKQFKEYMKTVSKSEWQKYYDAVKAEVDVYKNTGMCDYPLIDYEIVKKGIEMGGVITSTGRGSGPSFFTNTLCGFSKIDRITAPIKLYPERFMSETRILETHSLPDLDQNLGTPEIFEKAQEMVMGEGHSYPMIAFGTLKKKSAFKMLARATNMDFALANTISKQIHAYETDVKHAEDEDKDLINIFDYVEPQYHQYIEQSKKYWGIIDNKKKAPCAFILYSGDIKSEIGLIKCKTESTKREYITTVIDGAVAEKYKYLKNDLLKVNTVLLTDLVYKRLGIKPHSVVELSKAVANDDKVWSIYANGYTQGINQCEQEGARKKVMAYKPHNISELSAFVAAIRPGFKSMYSKFEAREYFAYGIKPLDDLLQTEEFPYSYILYQEQLMTVLHYAGFPMDECYQIIKDIAKKHPEKVLPLKDKFLKGFSEKILPEMSNLSEAEDVAKNVWQVISDSTAYSFNASHSYAMALDSLYGAWQKANYPYEFYEVYLQFYTEEGEKDKVATLKQEMEKAFGIAEGAYRWGVDNRCFKADPENHQMVPALMCLKGINQKCANAIYKLSQDGHEYSFGELIGKIYATTGINKGQFETLIKINYFEEFGNIEQLLALKDAYDELDRSQFNKNSDRELIKKYGTIIINNSEETDSLWRKFDRAKAIKEYEQCVREIRTPLIEVINYEFEIFGYIKTRLKISEDYAYVVDVNKKYKNKVIKLHRLKSGDAEIVKVKGGKYDADPVEVGDVIKIMETRDERKWKPDGNGGFERLEEYETILYKWSHVRC